MSPRESQTGSEPWHAACREDVLSRLAAVESGGLSSQEARARLVRAGPNRLSAEHRVRWPAVLARQFRDVLVAILAAAAVVSLAVGELLDAVAILAILALNGLLGFVQEWKAEKALAALKGILSHKATVLRDGVEAEIDAADLVPGDIVVLASGGRVPADLRLLEGYELLVDESALTGESVPVLKGTEELPVATALAERRSMAWMGSLVTSGRGRGVVVATGMGTELGRIAALTSSVEADPTPLQRRLAVLGKQLGVFALLASVFVGVAGWALGKPAFEMFLTSISLAVAVVPEGLPAVVTVTLTLGVRQMVRRRALPRCLQATETLGSVTTVLTDKTGTLTENQMTVRRIWTPACEVEVGGSGYRPEGAFSVDGRRIEPLERPGLRELLVTGTVCNRASVHAEGDEWVRAGDPTEAALQVLALKGGVDLAPGALIAEHPFSSDRKRMTVAVEAADGGRRAYAKGAPEVMLPRCSHVFGVDGARPLTPRDLELATAAYQAFAVGGMRTLALATRAVDEDVDPCSEEVERALTLLGIVGILDPPRPEVAEALRRAGSSGIRVLMITGDAPETAAAIAEQVGIPVGRVVTGTQLEELQDADLARILREPVLFARTTPEHKLRVARLLEDAGEVVGMTGDGVNDAPALREADVGIAMGVRGTDVARQAADLVLLDDNFASIINAVEEGRREFDNIRKFVRYLLSSNIGEAIAILVAIVLGCPLILLPIQILWINVVTDALTAMTLGLERAERDVMSRPPRGRDEKILDGPGTRSVLALGSYIGLASVALFLLSYGYLAPGDLVRAQTVAFTAMVVLEQVNLLNHRSLRVPLKDVGYGSNRWLLAALGGTAVLHLGALHLPPLQAVLHTTPLGWSEWGLVLSSAIPLFAVPEALKRRRFRREVSGLQSEP